MKILLSLDLSKEDEGKRWKLYEELKDLGWEKCGELTTTWKMDSDDVRPSSVKSSLVSIASNLGLKKQSLEFVFLTCSYGGGDFHEGKYPIM